MLDIAVAYNRYAFLGYEFLTWLWFVVEKEPGLPATVEPEITALDSGGGGRFVQRGAVGGGLPEEGEPEEQRRQCDDEGKPA